MPGGSAMPRNHWPPSLTTVVPGSTPEHRRLVSPARKPRTTCKRACSGRPSSEVSMATIKGVWPQKGCVRDGRARSLRGALAADVSVVDLDPRAGGAELVTPIALEHGLHPLVLKPPGSVSRDPKPPAQLDVGYSLLALAKQMHGAEPHPHRQLGALQNGTGDQRRLVPASLALKQLTALDLGILCPCAPWTLEALRPAPGEPRLPACLLIRIALLEPIVREALLVLHAVPRHCFTLKIIVFSGRYYLVPR